MSQRGYCASRSTVGEELRAVMSGAGGGHAVPRGTLLGSGLGLLHSLLHLLPSPGVPGREVVCAICIFLSNPHTNNGLQGCLDISA